MSKYGVLEECAAILDALGPDDTSAEKEQALRRETRAIGEAAQALRRLASAREIKKLHQFVREGIDGGQEVQKVISSKNAKPGNEAKHQLKNFSGECTGDTLVLQISHQETMLNRRMTFYYASADL
eukprot:9466788-Karenia_brevis.AAC.1